MTDLGATLFDSAFRVGLSVVAGVVAGAAWVSVRRMRVTVRHLTDTALVAVDLVTQMELARDPGRDVHDRLAHALEARLVVAEGPHVEPSMRRAAAQTMAAAFIEDVRRAGLTITTTDTD